MPLLSHISLYEPYCSAQAEILISRYPTNGVQSKLLVAPGLSVGSHEQLRRLPQQPFEESKVTAADLQNWGEVEGKDHLLEVILQMEDDQGQPQVTFEEALLVAFRDDNNKAIVLITGCLHVLEADAEQLRRRLLRHQLRGDWHEVPAKGNAPEVAIFWRGQLREYYDHLKGTGGLADTPFRAPMLKPANEPPNRGPGSLHEEKVFNVAALEPLLASLGSTGCALRLKKKNLTLGYTLLHLALMLLADKVHAELRDSDYRPLFTAQMAADAKRHLLDAQHMQLFEDWLQRMLRHAAEKQQHSAAARGRPSAAAAAAAGSAGGGDDLRGRGGVSPSRSGSSSPQSRMQPYEPQQSRFNLQSQQQQQQQQQLWQPPLQLQQQLWVVMGVHSRVWVQDRRVPLAVQQGCQQRMQ